MDQFDQNLTNYHVINQLIVTMRDNQAAVDDYLKTLDEDSVTTYNQTKQHTNQLLSQLEGKFSSLEVYFNLNAIKYSTQTSFEKWDRSIELRKNNQVKYFVDYYEGMKVYSYTEQYVQQLLLDGLDEGVDLYNNLVKKSSSLRTISLVIILATFVLSLFFGGLFSNYLVAPIKRLVDSSKRIAAGQLEVQLLEVKSGDEVGILTDAFNKMSESIRRHVEDLEKNALNERKFHEEEMELIRMQQLLQEAEFLALQSQINPHFLFNTLNTISRTAMFEGAHDTIKLIAALSNIFRFNLRNTGKSITLKEELDMIVEYIYLQKFRFKERLRFEIKHNENLETIDLPVFSIQPLVENAIIHGIEPKIEGGIVRLKIYHTKRYTYIKVLDTGIGMSNEKLQSIIDHEGIKSTNSIGVKNVLSRFQIFFEGKGTIKIRSRLGLGTVIVMAIPREEKVGELNV